MSSVFFLIQRFDKPSSRYRVLQFIPGIKEAGFSVKVAAVSNQGWSRWKILQEARNASIVFIQKKLFQPIELWFLRSKGAKLIYDFDDAIMCRNQPPGASSWTRQRLFEKIIKGSHAVLAGNHFLAEQASRFSEKVHVLPTMVDISQYSMRQSWHQDQAVTLGWLGSPATHGYLEQILPALQQVALSYPQIELKVVSSVFPREDHISIIRKKWKESEEQQDLESFDIGLAPLNTDRWCDGKCGLKLLQYLASGLPTVSSPGGAQKNIIQDGVNGFLASSQEEWVEKLSLLIKDAQKRKQFGLQGRKTVEEKYSLAQGHEILLGVMNELGH